MADMLGSKKDLILQKLAVRILKALGERPASLDVILLANAEMKSMKWRLLRKRTEPNVISFPEPKQFPHPETKKRYLGEIYLNRDLLQKNPDRALPLLLHGILHLLGYDHVEKKDAALMERIEEKTLTDLSSSRARGKRIKAIRSSRSSSHV
jgi:probable rRNA maturation factor